MQKFNFILKTANVKTGPIPVTYSDRSTCPPTCAHYRSDCYAETGPTRWAWGKVDKVGGSLADLCANIAKLPVGTFWRHNVAGDLPGTGETIDKKALAQIVTANLGLRGFTFTHKTAPENLRAIKAANRAGFTVNLSADNLAHADQLADTGAGPVAAIVPIDAPPKMLTPAGRAVIVCPAQLSETKTCANCQLCQRVNRAVIVGFRAHGSRAKIADQLARRVIPIQPAGV
jgi:hypothetical protein